MGSPRCYVVFRDRLSEEQIAKFGSCLTKFGTVAPKWEDSWLEIEGGTAVFGTDPEEDGVPRIALRMADEPPTTGGLLDETFASAVKRAVGWLPRQYADVGAFTSAAYNHTFVGRVASELASRYEGLIHLGTVCSLDESQPCPELPSELRDRVDRFASPIHPEDRQDPATLFRALKNSENRLDPVMKAFGRRYEEKVRKRVAAMPGKVWELVRRDGEVDSYLVDQAFMQVWLSDPGFHIG